MFVANLWRLVIRYDMNPVPTNSASGHSIFLSHDSEDADIARDICLQINKNLNTEVFCSSIPGGEPWEAVLQKSLRECQIGVMLATTKGVVNNWVNAEVAFMVAARKKVVPFLHGDAKPDDLRTFSKTFQAVKCDASGGCQGLVDRLREILAELAITDQGSDTDRDRVPVDDAAKEIKEMLRWAATNKQEMLIAGIALRLFFGGGSLLGEDLREAIRAGARIRMVLLEPSSGAAKRRNAYEASRGIGTVKEIVNSWEAALMLEGEFRNIGCGSFSVRTAPEMPVSVFITKEQALSRPYLYSVQGLHTPLDLARGKSRDTIQEHFEKLWGKRWILFDVGNVLVSFSHDKVCDNLIYLFKSDQDIGGLRSRLHDFFFGERSPHSRNSALDLGEDDLNEVLNEFVAEFADLLKHRPTLKEFQESWCDIFFQRIEPALDAMEFCKERGFEVGIASNTNEAHWEWLIERKLLESAKGSWWQDGSLFLSCRLKKKKNQKEFFQMVCDATGQAPENHLLIDDLPANIATAKEFGFQTLYVDGTLSRSALRTKLHENSLLWIH